MTVIASVGHVAIVTPDVERATAFYSGVLGLQVTEQTSSAAFLRCGSEHHSLAIYGGPSPALHHIGLEVSDESALISAKSQLAERGLRALDDRFDEPGQGPAVRYRDPEGNLIELYAGMAAGNPSSPSNYRPVKFGHLTFGVSNLQRSVAFFVNQLGFRVSDSMGEQIVWLRCNADHHGLAFVQTSSPTVHHYAFEVANWEHIKALCDHFFRNRIRILYGPSRHGPGENLFTYVGDPDGNIVELFCELQQITDEDSYSPLVWKDEPKTIDVWRGLAPPDGFLQGKGRAFNDWRWGSPIIGAGWEVTSLGDTSHVSPPTVTCPELEISASSFSPHRDLPLGRAHSLLCTDRSIPVGRGLTVSVEMQVSTARRDRGSHSQRGRTQFGSGILALIDDSTGLVLTFEVAGDGVAISRGLYPVTIGSVKPNYSPTIDLHLVDVPDATSTWHQYEIRYHAGEDLAIFSPAADRAEWYVDGRLVHSVEWVANIGTRPPPIAKPANLRIGLGIFGPPDSAPKEKARRSPGTGVPAVEQPFTVRWRALDVRS